ncbi:MAG: hypothetical protein CVV03_09215 [Firmicutes bacterium HGW-Firmicutes-8]|nr:MAG: hypothetical protein CVV03_09215 [Firmicutes bacterium HGW-Firmicutes-8]
MWDEEDDLLYLRSRYYQPEVGRFATRDAFPGFASNPLSMHKYAYVENDPVNYVDPFGFNKKDDGKKAVTGLPSLQAVSIGDSYGVDPGATWKEQVYAFRNNKPIRDIELTGYWPIDLNPEEEKIYDSDPWKGIQTLLLGQCALDEANRRYSSDQLYNGNGDAFRHALWSGLMTRDCGVNWAKKVGDAHENGAKNNPELEKKMDLHNNEVGRKIAIDNRNSPFDELANLVQQSVEGGKMWRIVGDQIVKTNSEGVINGY